MRLEVHGYEAIELLEIYYTDKKWPLPKFDIDDMCCPVDQGDGGIVVFWDILDLKNQKVIKVNDYFDSEHGGHEIQTVVVNEDGNSMYNEAKEKINPYDRTYPTAISVEILINAILLDALNSSGRKRKDEEEMRGGKK